MKRIMTASAMVVFITISAAATPKLFRQHKLWLKNGARVVKNCSSCHNSATGLKKRKGQDIKIILKTATCSGKGCHGS